MGSSATSELARFYLELVPLLNPFDRYRSLLLVLSLLLMFLFHSPTPAFLDLLTPTSALPPLRPHRRRHHTTLSITIDWRLFSLYSFVFYPLSRFVWFGLGFLLSYNDSE